MRDGEIEVVVIAAAGVEGGAARGADRVGLEIGGDGEFGAAGAAENGWREPFGLRPRDEGVIAEGVVAVFAGVVSGAAFHFDGDDVGRAMVVEAAGLGIEVEAADFWNVCRHGIGDG